MLLSKTPLASGLLAIVTLSIAVSASLDPIEQHLSSRDASSFQASKEATGKLATPINLGQTSVSPQTVLKLTGQDLHSDLPDKSSSSSAFEASNIVVPGDPVRSEDLSDRAHCSFGHETANIKRIRYTMTVKIDRDESGATTVAGADSLHGVVIKATSGLYSNSNPDKGSCAKTLARHGEVCANRPYIVPQAIVPVGVSARAATGNDKPEPVGETPKAGPNEPAYHAGPYVLKRSTTSDVPTLDDWKSLDQSADLIFKRDTSSNSPKYQNDRTVSDSHTTITNPSSTICIDTVKRDKHITKIVPTRTHTLTTDQSPTSPLHFELVRSDSKANTWNQIIYNAHGQPVDITHLSLTSNMSFWRAEYYCADCKKGDRQHTILYENVEIEVDQVNDHVPSVQCEGDATSTNVHKRQTSRYAGKNGSGVEYSGVVFAIDRVALGMFNGKGKGGMSGYAEGHVNGVSGSVSATGQQTPSVEESKENVQKEPIAVQRRDVEVAEDGPVF
ncbi:hypothetical protein PHSY_004284 [Pseudozyma hubeiensis SY62]|uniref:Uncharacterized protein n=1 Tax=Pseudozyma hubeiensis (strain SY62) TaxID=1305764 RepID=R9PF27_PSEHS|nr:hypothetical protein PHSY_004284 [Pseudozyma hubeiensis SY62]GAC96700.1 hypothetical protein PHSY_004284 [Pseudozyma hubeiensis SY62]